MLQPNNAGSKIVNSDIKQNHLLVKVTNDLVKATRPWVENFL